MNLSKSLWPKSLCFDVKWTRKFWVIFKILTLYIYECACVYVCVRVHACAHTCVCSVAKSSHYLQPHRLYAPPSMGFSSRYMEWVAISFSKGSSQSRDWTHISCTHKRVIYHWATRETKYIYMCVSVCVYIHTYMFMLIYITEVYNM